jgi:sugar/nucleoside kinase (ribokinase family)
MFNWQSSPKVERALRRYSLKSLPQKEIISLLKFANAAADLTTTKKGIISALPTTREVLGLLET